MLIEFARMLIYPYLPIRTIRKIQNKKLLKLFKHASTNVGYYKSLYDKIDPIEISSIDDLHKLPVIKQIDWRNQPLNQILGAGADTTKMLKFTTSGTSLKYATLYVSKKENALRQLKALRSMIQLGWRPWWVGVQIWRETKKQTHSFFQKLLNKKRFFVSVKLPPAEQLKQINRLKPAILYGMLTPLEILADHLIAENKVLPLKFVMSGGEVKHPSVRGKFKKAFGHPGYERYGAVELGIVAYNIPNSKNLYIDEDSFIVEVLDKNDQPIKEGVGRIVITALDQLAMPLIRYDIGDVVTLPQNLDRSRINYQQIQTIQGRSNYNLTLKGGRVIAGQAIMDLTFASSYVKRYQFVQDQDGNATMRFEKKQNVDNEVIKSEVLEYFGFDKNAIGFEECEYIAPEKNGKFNMIKKVTIVNPS